MSFYYLDLEKIEPIMQEIDKNIKIYLRQTNINERDDLSQELKIKVLEKLEGLLFLENTPGFWEYLKNI